MTSDPPIADPSTAAAPALSRTSAWAFAIAAAGAAILCAVLLVLKTPGVNGPPNFPWTYRTPPASFLLWFAAALAPMLAWMLLRPSSGGRRIASLATICVCAMALRVTVAVHLQHEVGWSEVDRIVRSEFATSYYHDGKRLIEFADLLRARGEPVGHWISIYDIFLPAARVHTRVKPPGAVIYWMAWLSAAGDTQAPIAGALMQMALASLAPLLVYLLSVRLGLTQQTSLLAAALMAISPGYLLSTPAFDPVYPIFTCALMIAWLNAVDRGSAWWACGAGAIVAVGTLMSLHLLTVGIAVAAAPFIAGRLAPRTILRRTLALSPVVAGAVVALYLAFVVRYDYAAISVIQQCFENQKEARWLDPARFTFAASLFDLSDAALGIGWATAAAFAASLVYRSVARPARKLACAAGITVAIIAGMHLLPAETARVWNVFFPLLIIPAAAVLDALPQRARVLTLVCHAMAVIATCAMLIFILA